MNEKHEPSQNSTIKKKTLLQTVIIFIYLFIYLEKWWLHPSVRVLMLVSFMMKDKSCCASQFLQEYKM